MLGATFKSLFARKFRLVMSALSIVLGIAFVAGSLMFTNMLSRTVDAITQATVADVNVKSVDESPVTSEVQLLSAELLEQVRGVAGVKAAVPVVSSNQMYLLNTESKLVAVSGAPGVGSNWIPLPAAGGRQGLHVVDGERPETAGQLAVDPSTLARSGHKIGDTVKISTPTQGVQEMTLVGTAMYGDGATAGASYLFFSDVDAKRLMQNDLSGSRGIWVQTDSGTNREQVAEAIDDLLPPGWDAKTGKEMGADFAKQFGTGLEFVNTLLLVFAAISLLIASLLILNTFSIIVLQRSRELALYRAIGASRGQLQRSVLVEALVVAIIGTVLGIALGFGLAWGLLVVLRWAGIHIGDITPQLSLDVIVLSLVVGVIVTVIAALVPSWRAGRTRPVEALQAAALPKVEKGLTPGTMTGVVLIELAIAMLVIGVFINVRTPMLWVGSGSVLMLVGSVLAVTLLGTPILWALSKVFRRLFGEIGKMAELNARRQPGRTAATAATLVIGLTLVTTVAVVASSVTASIRQSLSADVRGNFLVNSVVNESFAATVAADAAKIEGVERVASFAPGQAIPGGMQEPVTISGQYPSELAMASAVEVVSGSFTAEKDAAVITETFASQSGLVLGERFDLTGPLGKVRLLVTGVASDASNPPGAIMLHRDTMAKISDTSLTTSVVVFVSDGADRQAVEKRLSTLTDGNPTVVVTDVDDFVQKRVEQFQTIAGILYGLLGLALVISLLGIVNTLSLSVIERTREIGLLRAVGVSRTQIRRMISLEAIIVTTMGALLGVLLGLLFGVVLQQANADSGIQVLDVPWLQLLAIVAVAGLFGWLAAMVPAHRASRLPVLQSIADE